MKLYGRNTSINVQKAAWVMGEAELNWEWIDKEGGVGTIDTPVSYTHLTLPTICSV